MGILDFREIASPNRNHTKTSNNKIGKSNSVDDFELFAQEFFLTVKKMSIFKSVSNGPDDGIDLGVESASDGTRWLVSCKHYAHSDQPVSREESIIERVRDWDCDGFIAFYTTVPSTTVDSRLSGAEKHKIKVIRYTKEAIEHELLNSAEGTAIAARYFPISMTNHYGTIIKTIQHISPDDVLLEGNVVKYGNHAYPLQNLSPSTIQEAKARIANYENLIKTSIQQKPYFERACRDAAELYPKYFIKRTSASGKSIYTPKWNTLRLSLERKSIIYFINAAWSFWDDSKANTSLAETMALRNTHPHPPNIKGLKNLKKSEDFINELNSQKPRKPLTPYILCKILPENLRDIIGRLFLYG